MLGFKLNHVSKRGPRCRSQFKSNFSVAHDQLTVTENQKDHFIVLFNKTVLISDMKIEIDGPKIDEETSLTFMWI